MFVYRDPWNAVFVLRTLFLFFPSRRIRLHKSRAQSCSSSDASDDDRSASEPPQPDPNNPASCHFLTKVWWPPNAVLHSSIEIEKPQMGLSQKAMGRCFCYGKVFCTLKLMEMRREGIYKNAFFGPLKARCGHKGLYAKWGRTQGFRKYP